MHGWIGWFAPCILRTRFMVDGLKHMEEAGRVSGGDAPPMQCCTPQSRHGLRTPRVQQCTSKVCCNANVAAMLAESRCPKLAKSVIRVFINRVRFPGNKVENVAMPREKHSNPLPVDYPTTTIAHPGLIRLGGALEGLLQERRSSITTNSHSLRAP